MEVIECADVASPSQRQKTGAGEHSEASSSGRGPPELPSGVPPLGVCCVSGAATQARLQAARAAPQRLPEASLAMTTANSTGQL